MGLDVDYIEPIFIDLITKRYKKLDQVTVLSLWQDNIVNILSQQFKEVEFNSKFYIVTES